MQGRVAMMGSSDATLTQRALALKEKSKRVVEGLPSYVKAVSGGSVALINELSALVVDLAKKIEVGGSNDNRE